MASHPVDDILCVNCHCTHDPYVKCEDVKLVQGMHNFLGNQIYSACMAFEKLENAGILKGNGHHIAQHISMAVQNYLRERLPENFKRVVEEKKVWDNQLRLT